MRHSLMPALLHGDCSSPDMSLQLRPLLQSHGDLLCWMEDVLSTPTHCTWMELLPMTVLLIRDLICNYTPLPVLLLLDRSMTLRLELTTTSNLSKALRLKSFFLRYLTPLLPLLIKTTPRLPVQWSKSCMTLWLPPRMAVVPYLVTTFGEMMVLTETTLDFTQWTMSSQQSTLTLMLWRKECTGISTERETSMDGETSQLLASRSLLMSHRDQLCPDWSQLHQVRSKWSSSHLQRLVVATLPLSSCG